MKILYLLSEFPYPARGGGALRTLGLIRGAAAAGHEVHLLAFGSAAAMLNAETPLHKLCHSLQILPAPTRTRLGRLGTLLLSEQADMERRFWSRAFLEALQGKLDQTLFDLIQFESLEMTPYFFYTHKYQPQAKMIYDAFNAESDIQRLAYETDRQQWRRFPLAAYSWIQWRRLQRYEHFLYQIIDAVMVVSEEDLNAIKALAGSAPLYLVPNGIDVQDYTTTPKNKIEMKNPAVVFTGVMNYRPNVDAVLWFAQEVLPLLSGVHFYIVGNQPTTAVKALGENPNITVTGFVPDVLPYLHQANAVIAPLRIGSGTRLKLLQAMAAGAGIVATSIGAMGLKVEHERELLIADTPASFAEAVRRLIQNELQRLELGSRAQVFVKSKFDWTVILPRLLAAYKDIMAH
jgi:glycosyltransferase involved in cell wall biosynthesis